MTTYEAEVEHWLRGVAKAYVMAEKSAAQLQEDLEKTGKLEAIVKAAKTGEATDDPVITQHVKYIQNVSTFVKDFVQRIYVVEDDWKQATAELKQLEAYHDREVAPAVKAYEQQAELLTAGKSLHEQPDWGHITKARQARYRSILHDLDIKKQLLEIRESYHERIAGVIKQTPFLYATLIGGERENP